MKRNVRPFLAGAIILCVVFLLLFPRLRQTAPPSTDGPTGLPANKKIEEKLRPVDTSVSILPGEDSGKKSDPISQSVAATNGLSPDDSHPQGSIELTVVEQRTRIPMPKLSVWLHPLDGSDSPVLKKFTDTKGNISLRSVAAIRYHLTMRWYAGKPIDGPDLNVEPQLHQRKEVEFPALPTYVFRALLANGKPAAGITLRAGFHPDSHKGVRDPEEGGFAETVVSNVDGTFLVSFAPRMGPFELSSSKVLLSTKAEGPWTQFVEFDDLKQDANEVFISLDPAEVVVHLQEQPRLKGKEAFHLTAYAGQRAIYEGRFTGDRHAFTAANGSHLNIRIGRILGGYETIDGSVMADIKAPRTVVEFPFPTLEVVRCDVALPDGTGVRGAVVGAVSSSERPFRLDSQLDRRYLSPPSDNRGRTSLEVEAGRSYLFLPTPGDEAFPQGFIAGPPKLVAWDDMAHETVHLVLCPSNLVWGTVENAEGKPVQGAVITALGQHYHPIGESVTTDSDGVFQLNTLVEIGNTDPKSRHLLLASSPSGGMALGYSPINPETPLHLRLSPVGSITVHLPEGIESDLTMVHLNVTGGSKPLRASPLNLLDLGIRVSHPQQTVLEISGIPIGATSVVVESSLEGTGGSLTAAVTQPGDIYFEDPR